MRSDDFIMDTLMEKVAALEKENLAKAKNDPQLASELYATDLYPEFERFYYPYKPGVLKRGSRN